MGKCECGRLKGNPCGPLRPNTINVTMPLGDLTISTHGRENLVTGSVAVAANGTFGGVLRFDLPEIGVAGVGSGFPLSLFPSSKTSIEIY